MIPQAEKIRNIAIVAHVDHGKTTLVDGLLRQSGLLRVNQDIGERALDTNDIERERGITILAKVTAINWKDHKINIVDTPGHADFGGEVERILSMVDGVLLLVDAAEGPMPQTKFVLSKALGLGLNPILCINKVDRSDARSDEVLNETFDLFVALDANETQLDFPILYACGREGWATAEWDAAQSSDKELSLAPLLDLVVERVPAPSIEPDAPFSLLATTLERDAFLGRVLTGRIHSGAIETGDAVKVLTAESALVEQARVTKLLSFSGLRRLPVQRAEAGDIVAIAGLERATVSQSIVAPEVLQALPAQPIDPPTLAMTFSVNDSPLAGREGDKVTGRLLLDRLRRETEGNVALELRDSPMKDAFEVAGRGELQLAVLLETLRREGFELSVSRPQVLMKKDAESGKLLEPLEEVIVDLDSEFSGLVVDKLAQRKAELKDQRPSGAGKTRLTFLAPTRALIGYYSDFLTDTRGTGLMHRLFHAYAPHRGPLSRRREGAMISTEQGRAVAYALWNLEERGPLFISPGEQVYKGMILGEHNKGQDIEVNPLKSKQLTNFRAAGSDEAIRLTPKRNLTLERAIAYIEEDELVEVTPKSIRLRKRFLDPHERKRRARNSEGQAA